MNDLPHSYLPTCYMKDAPNLSRLLEAGSGGTRVQHEAGVAALT